MIIMGPAMAQAIEDGSQYNDIGAMIAFYENSPEFYDDNADQFVIDFEDSFAGEWDNFKEYAEQLFDEVYLHEVPDWFVTYIDYDKFTRDLAYDYWTEDVPGSYGVYVFRSN